MRIVCVGYREWALKIYQTLAEDKKNDILIIKNKNKLNFDRIKKFNPEYCFFYGWSWIVSKKFIDNFKCIMLHPSPLPKYRGGSPIQNQIIRGEKKSAVTIFLMNNIVDGGDILFQEKIELNGSLDEIFERIIKIGIKNTKKLIKGNFKPIKQNHKIATYFNRLTPSNSEITIKEIKKQSSKYLYDKIRMLADPYPNAFIKTSDGKKIFIKKVSLK